MSAIGAKIAALEGEIAELQVWCRDANTPEERKDRLLEAIIAKENRLTELLKSGNVIDCDLLIKLYFPSGTNST